MHSRRPRYERQIAQPRCEKPRHHRLLAFAGTIPSESIEPWCVLMVGAPQISSDATWRRRTSLLPAETTQDLTIMRGKLMHSSRK
jgi:hypothetical protein